MITRICDSQIHPGQVSRFSHPRRGSLGNPRNLNLTVSVNESSPPKIKKWDANTALRHWSNYKSHSPTTLLPHRYHFPSQLTPIILSLHFILSIPCAMANPNGAPSDLRATFLDVYSVLKSDLLNDPAFEWTDGSRQWVERVSFFFFIELPYVAFLFFFVCVCSSPGCYTGWIASQCVPYIIARVWVSEWLYVDEWWYIV